MTFRIARQDFIMEAGRVRGLLPMHDMVALHPPRGWILGVAALLGVDFPVIDVRGKLGIPQGTRGRRPYIVAVEIPTPHGPQVAGFIADRLSDVIELRGREILEGIIRIHGRSRRVFDPDLVLAAH